MRNEGTQVTRSKKTSIAFLIKEAIKSSHTPLPARDIIKYVTKKRPNTIGNSIRALLTMMYDKGEIKKETSFENPKNPVYVFSLKNSEKKNSHVVQPEAQKSKIKNRRTPQKNLEKFRNNSVNPSASFSAIHIHIHID